MDTATAIITTLLNIPTEVYVAIITAIGVSLVTQFSKKVLSIENEKVIMALFGGFSFLASGADYLMSAHNLPPTVLGLNTALIIGIATPFYTYVLKPVDKFVSTILAYRSQLEAKLKEVETTLPPQVPAVAPALNLAGTAPLVASAMDTATPAPDFISAPAPTTPPVPAPVVAPQTADF